MFSEKHVFDPGHNPPECLVYLDRGNWVLVMLQYTLV